MIDRPMTVRMMPKLAMSPVRLEMAAANSRIITSGSAKRLAIFVTMLGRLVAATVFGPNCASRSATSAPLKPRGLLCARSNSAAVVARQ